MSSSFNINSLDPLNISFDDLKHKLSLSSILPRDITEIAFLFRKDYKKANELYEMALNKVDRENEKYINEIKIYMLGLKLQHGIYKEKDFYELNMIDDKRLDLLKGYYFYNKREYEKAYFSFSKVPYSMGMNLASYGLNKFCIDTEENNTKMKCYTDSKYWEDYKEEDDDNKDFLYRIGKSKEYENENNIDVILTIIENELKNNCSEKRMEDHIRNLLNLKNTYNNSPEILYLLGKINHMRKNYENAKEYYVEVLKLDSEYTPAVLNLCKITGNIILKNCKYNVVNDVIALMSIINKKYDININECSDCIRKICQLMIKDRTNDLSIVNDYEKLIEGKYFENIQDESDIRIKNGWINKKLDEKLKIDEILFDKEAIYNNLAILQKDKKSSKLLKDAIEFGSKEYEEYLKYNFGVINKDINILETLNIKEAKLQMCLFNKDSSVDIQELRTYILYEKNPEESEKLFKQIAEKNDNQKFLYAIIWIGCINIDKYLKYNNKKYLAEASKFFMKNVRSFYCINGLGIIEYYSGRYKCAIKYFEQIIDEYNLALYNIACCYIKMENYLKGKEIMAEYLKIYDEDINAKNLFDFCNSQLKVNNSNNLLENDLEIENISSNYKKNNNNIDKEAERKRKIDDILETRKKLNLN